MKKNLFTLIMLMLVVSLSGCSGQKKLEKALNELSEESYTMHGDMEVNVTYTYMGQIMSESMESDMIIEADPIQTYTITTSDGNNSYTYTKIENDKIKTYSKLDNNWELISINDIEDKNSEITDLLNVDVEFKDVFSKVDGVWVGNPEKMTEVLKATLDALAEDFGGMGVTIEETKIDKYTIELEKGHVSEIELDMTMSFVATQGGVNLNMTVTLELDLEVSKVGKTSVTIPEGLPTE